MELHASQLAAVNIQAGAAACAGMARLQAVYHAARLLHTVAAKITINEQQLQATGWLLHATLQLKFQILRYTLRYVHTQAHQTAC